MSRRNLRQVPRINYFEPEEPSWDEYIYCDKCGDYVYEYCSIHGHLLVIPDDKVPTKVKFPSYVPRAALTIPHVFLHLAPSIIPGAGLGVYATLTLPCGVRFGPYRGPRTQDIDSMYGWQIYDRNNKPSHVVDAADANRSNWMRYVNCSRHWCEQNLIAYQYQGELYYRTIRTIPRFTELMVFYGGEFAYRLGVDIAKYNSPLPQVHKSGATVARKLKTEVKKSEYDTKKEHFIEKDNFKASEPKFNNIKKPIPNDNIQITVENTCDQNNNGKRCNDITDVNLDKQQNIITKSNISNTVNNSKTHESITSSVRLYTCDDCKKSFKSKRSLKSHMFLHTNEKPYKCDICERRFIHIGHLNVHLRIHTGDKPYTCNVFEKQSLVHTKEKPFRCDICEKQFAHKSTLKIHLRIHSGDKPYTCNVCNKSFNRADILKSHMFLHTNENPYKCDICEKRFTQIGNLKTHLRIHSGDKPYTCNVCNKSFNVACNLKIHSLVHTKEKPYKCDICEKRFTQIGNLKTHLRIHSGDKPYTCDVCNNSFRYLRTMKSHLKVHM